MNELVSRMSGVFKVPSSRFQVKYPGKVHLKVSGPEFSGIISDLARQDFLIADLFAVENYRDDTGLTLFYVFEKKGYKEFLVIQRKAEGKAPSIAREFPAACWLERGVADGFGVEFDGSYDIRRLFLHEPYPDGFHPLRKSFHGGPVRLRKDAPDYQFKEVKGEGVYQIPVGPVHAGIIEPGHFRFSVIGENIFNLEVRMFWKHRGLEKLSEGRDLIDVLPVAEAVSGDETVANAWAYCLAVERLSGIEVPRRGDSLRVLYAELERIYSLLGDLAGMVTDVAYPAGASPFFILREEVLRWNERLAGSRFLRGAVTVGGAGHDVAAPDLRALSVYLEAFGPRLRDAVSRVLSFPSVRDRFESTGLVRKSLVRSLSLSGPIARASGVLSDARVDHPYGLYQKIPPALKVLESGDVYSRFYVKASTVEDSIRILLKVIKDMPSGSIRSTARIKDGSAIGVVESCRGQSIHWVYVKDGEIGRHRIRTASFFNWRAIEHAVLGNIVPDFPLINKSMNLSYAGTDL